MAAALLDRPSGSTAVLAGAGVLLLVGIAAVDRLELLRHDVLVEGLALLVGCAMVLLLAQHRRLGKAAELHRLQRAVIDSSPNAVITSDNDGRVVDFNPAAARLFGMPGAGLEKAWMSDLIAVPQAGSGLASVHGNVLDQLGHRMTVEGRQLDGSLVPMEVSILRVGAGKQTMFAAYIRDLTEQRRADAAQQAQQDRIHQSEKLNAMGSLLAGVAHELNNPLAILVTQATLLREKAPTPDVGRRAERIHAAAQRAGRIVKTFLAMARQKTPVLAATEINGIVEAAVELVGYGLRSAGIEVKLELDPDLPPVEADRDLLGQCFAAVLINAQQALAEQAGTRQIVVRSRTEESEVLVDIADTGRGIGDEIRDRIFEPYFTTKPVGAGTGIGLSVCRSIMKAHSGRIEVGPSRGEGSTFRIAIPALPKPDFVEAVPQRRSRLSILVIDDEVDVADSLAELLDVFGHDAVVMSSPAEAVERLKRQSFDAVITDLRMPGMSGVALLRAIRAVDPRLAERTVLMTGDTVMGTGQASCEGGADGLLLEKPFTAESVRAVLDRIRA